MVRQSADLIRERIVVGQLGPNLPGENELARMLDVSRPTIRGALGLLEGELIVAPASNGIARRVTKDWFACNKTGPAVRFLLPTPLHERSAGFQAEMRQMRERLASHGAEVVFQVSSAFRARHPEVALRVCRRVVPPPFAAHGW